MNRKSWLKLLRRTVLAAACVAVVGYVSLRLWQWVSVPRDAPVIGFSLDTAWHAQAGITTKWYEVGLTRAGGRVLEVRPENGDPDEILERIDALLLAGGGDIDPELYGGAAGDAHLVDRRRDDFELALIGGALERDMPILGVCRGIQILNVYQGGTLRNLRSDPEASAAHGIGLDSMDAHPVEILAGSRLARILGAGEHRANSFHGQAVGQVGPGLRVAAEAPHGVVEAIELPEHRFVIGMQWHPEIFPQQMEVFEAFLKEARAYRRRRESRLR